LLNETCVPQGDLKHVDVVRKGHKICKSDTQQPGTIVVDWVKQESTQSS